MAGDSQYTRHAALIAYSPFCIHEIDAQGRLCSMNPAGLTMMGAADEAEIIGLPYLDAVCVDDRARVHDLLQRALAGSFAEYEFTTVSGRVLRSNVVPLPANDDHPARLMGITQDVTEHRRLERELHHSRQLDAIGRLAGGVAHDFNNLLTVILGSADLLQSRAEGSPSREILAIRSAAERAAELTAQLLTFARRTAVQPLRIDLCLHMPRAEVLLRRVLDETLTLALTLPPGALVVRIDPGHLDQILMNLVANARDACDPGGRVTITVSAVLLGSNDPRPDGLSPGPYARVSVMDDGCGIPPAVRAQLFEPFFTTKTQATAGRTGTGLGLATANTIARQAGGAIEVVSEVGEGTTVVVYLPHLVDDPVEAQPPGTHAPVACPATILIVEDDALVRGTAELVLTSGGYAVLSAASAEEALELVSDSAPTLDLLLTDVVLPNLNGVDLADRLRAARPELRVVYSSGYATGEGPQAGRIAKDAIVLPKPYGVQDLLWTVASALKDPTSPSG